MVRDGGVEVMGGDEELAGVKLVAAVSLEARRMCYKT